MKNHLDFDIDFLDRPAPTTDVRVPVQSAIKPATTPWKPWFIGGGILFTLMIIVALSDSSSTSTSITSNPVRVPPSSTNDVRVGQYSCSSYNSDRVEDLEPDVSKAAIDSESNSLDARIAALDSQGSRIENMQVDEYDQASIDSYNTQVDAYNVAKRSLDTDVATYNERLKRFNSQVDTYNSFLENNCTRNR